MQIARNVQLDQKRRYWPCYLFNFSLKLSKPNEGGGKKETGKGREKINRGQKAKIQTCPVIVRSRLLIRASELFFLTDRREF